MASKGGAHSKYSDYLNQGKSQYKSGQYRAALKSFNKALTYDPKSRWALNEKGNALRMLGQYHDALRCYDSAISFDRVHSYPFPYIGKGDIYREQQSFSKAISEYNRAIKIKRHPWALNGKAQCLYATGKSDPAFRLAEEAIRLRPAFVYPYILEGDILSDRGSYRDALQKYEKALSILPISATELRANISGNIQKCHTNIQYKDGGRLKNHNNQNRNGTHSKYHTHKNTEDVHLVYRDHLDRGKEFFDLKRFPEALQSFELALENEPKSKWAWSWKGDTLRKLGRGDEAVRCYEQAISLDRSYSYIYPRIGKGDIYREQGLYSPALLEYDRAIGIKRHPRALFGKAQCLYETGAREQAFQLAKEVMQLNPSFMFSYILAGDVLFEQGSYDEALSEYEKALPLVYPGSTDILTSLNRKIQNCQMNGKPKKKNQIRDVWPFKRKNQHVQMNVPPVPEADTSSKVKGSNSDIPALLHLLSTGTNQERTDASGSLDRCVKKNLAAQIIRQKPFSLFERSLQDRVSDVRKNIAWALGNLAVNSYSHEVAESGILCCLADCLCDPSEDVRSAAAWSLAVIAQYGQGICVAETGMVRPCIRLMDDQNAVVREMAAFALDKVAFYASPEPLVHENGVAALAHHIMDTETAVRQKSLWALWSVACRGYADSLCEVDTLITDLKMCAQSRNLEVCKAAISVIGELATVTQKSFLENKDLEQILLKGLSSRSNRVRGASVWAIGRWIDAGIDQGFTRNGVKEQLKECRKDTVRVHVFDHNERRWKERSIGGIAGVVLKKFDTPLPPSPESSKSDYKTAYFIAISYVNALQQNQLQNARESGIHLERVVSDSILQDVKKQRDLLDLYSRQGIDEIPGEFVDEAGLLKEAIHAKAME